MINWINPKERLPQSEEEILVTVKAGAHYDGNIIFENNVEPSFFVNDPEVDGSETPHFYLWFKDEPFKTEDIIAWMPLPKPYEEVTNA